MKRAYFQHTREIRTFPTDTKMAGTGTCQSVGPAAICVFRAEFSVLGRTLCRLFLACGFGHFRRLGLGSLGGLGDLFKFRKVRGKVHGISDCLCCCMDSLDKIAARLFEVCFGRHQIEMQPADLTVAGYSVCMMLPGTMLPPKLDRVDIVVGVELLGRSLNP